MALPALTELITRTQQGQPIHDPALSLLALGSAMDLVTHPAINAYYSSWFSQPIACTYKGYLPLSLCFAADADDYAALQHHLTAHLFMLRRLKRPPSWFIATVTHPEHSITLDNTSGEIYYDRLTTGQRTYLACDLNTFLAKLILA